MILTWAPVLQECGRQSLDELMMRPVQRLPSVTLLLNDLLKHTRREKDHTDVVALENALAKIKEVLVHSIHRLSFSLRDRGFNLFVCFLMPRDRDANCRSERNYIFLLISKYS
jgi:hypothetical protein